MVPGFILFSTKMKPFCIFLFSFDSISLQLNKTFVIPDIHRALNMADIGSYDHEKNELKWIGTSMMNSTLCNIIEYRALDNKLEIKLNEMKSKGSELYWGNIWISQKDRVSDFKKWIDK